MSAKQIEFSLGTFPAITVLVMASVAGSIFPASTVAEEVLVIDAASRSESSPHQWLFQGATKIDGTAVPEMALSPEPESIPAGHDLAITFDGAVPSDVAGHWAVEAIGPYERSAASRFGEGAGAFRAPTTRLSLERGSSPLFEPGLPMGDFSIEFWLKPTRADSGEIVFMWKANRRSGKTWLSQQVSCIILRNRLMFGFLNFFDNPAGKATSLSLQGSSVIVPATWSHHLIRFDSATGLLEYLMNGKPEAVTYATSTGKQAGAVFNPVAGESGRLEIAQNYTGLIDEFLIRPVFIERAAMARYPSSGGVIVSPIFDLGMTNSSIVGIEPVYRTPGESAIHWNFRTGDSSAGWRDESPEWKPFQPGAMRNPGSTAPKGRYIQFRLELYPDAQGERSPAISTIRIRYEPDSPPPPPSGASAAAGNGRVTVRWSSVTESDVRGYVVYYGVSSGDYFGTGAVEGPSPVFVRSADATSLTLNGLKNGTLYFIAVAAFDGAEPPHIGEFSREITARPSRVSP
jgi:hypothetical protein